MSLADYEFITALGKGAFADVIKVKNKKNGNIYAMKRINISQLKKEEIEKELNEIRLLYSLNHPNIIGYKEALYDNSTGKLNIVLEFADDGDLLQKIKYNKENRLNFHEDTIWEIIIQMLLGVSYLHSSKIIHRDLKSANIFLMKNGQLKIGDLNVSKHMKSSQACTTVGTPLYIAPEIWGNQYYDYKCDIWSLGCIIYELCTLKPPFMGSSFSQLKKAITSGVYKAIPQFYSNDLKILISWMIQIEPNKRKSAQELLDSKIIQLRIKNNPNFVQYQGLKDRFLKASIIKTIILPKSIKNINKVLPIKELQEKENENMKNLDKNKKTNFTNNKIKKIEIYNYKKVPIKNKKKKKIKKKKISYDREEIPNTDRNNNYKDNPLMEINININKRKYSDDLSYNKDNYRKINNNNNILYKNNSNLNNGYSSGSNNIYNHNNGSNSNNNDNYNNFNNNNYNNNYNNNIIGNRNFENRNYGNNNLYKNNNYNKNNINNSNYYNNSKMSTNVSNFNNENNSNYSNCSSINTNKNFNNSNINTNNNSNVPNFNFNNSNMDNSNYNNNNFNKNMNYNNMNYNNMNNNNMNYNNMNNNNMNYNNMNYNNMNNNNNSNYNNNYNNGNNIRNINVNINNYINNNFNNNNMNNRNINMNMNMDNNMNNHNPIRHNINNRNDYGINGNNINENKAHIRPKSGRANMRNLNNYYNNNVMKNEMYNNYNNNFFNNNNKRNLIDAYPFNQGYNRNSSNKIRKY